jgi:hypothetical protein
VDDARSGSCSMLSFGVYSVKPTGCVILPKVSSIFCVGIRSLIRNSNVGLLHIILSNDSLIKSMVDALLTFAITSGT